MPHIKLPEGLPGISANFAFRPETARPLRELAHILLHEPNSLAPGERELIASHVSSLNECWFCQASHSAAAACHLEDQSVLTDLGGFLEGSTITPKMRALLGIAGKVQKSGKSVTAADVAAAFPEEEAVQQMVAFLRAGGERAICTPRDGKDEMA